MRGVNNMFYQDLDFFLKNVQTIDSRVGMNKTEL